jgi:hypothetical protein
VIPAEIVVIAGATPAEIVVIAGEIDIRLQMILSLTVIAPAGRRERCSVVEMAVAVSPQSP